MTLTLIGAISHSTPRYKEGVRERYGGGVMYGGFASRMLSVVTNVVTIGAPDIEPGIEELKKHGATVSRIPRKTSNNFANDYTATPRKLQMKSIIEAPMTTEEVRAGYTKSAGVVLCPIYNEMDIHIFDCFKDSEVLMLDAQGFTRGVAPLNESGYYPIVQTHWTSINEYKNRVTVLKLSDEDLSNIILPGKYDEIDKIEHLTREGFPIIILTRGERPVAVAKRGARTCFVPTYPVDVVDAGGAGDTFGVGFMVECLESHDLIRATALGNAVASFKISGKPYNTKTAKERAIRILSSINTQK